jgi:hypothetical protein
MVRRSALAVPVDLRARLEAGRLDLPALFRALDRMDLSEGRRTNYSNWMPIMWNPLEVSVRKTLDPRDACDMVPGGNRHNG